LVNMTGYTWLRINITSSLGGTPAIKMDVYDASQGQQDTYLMLGDSITAEGMAHSNIDLSGSWNGGSLTQLINASNSAYYPSIVDGGTGGVTAEWGATYIANMLAPYSGRYVALNYGTNDANQSGALTSDQITSYYNSLLIMVDAIQSRGMVAIVPHIPWGCASSGWLGTNAKTLNDYVDAHLFVDRPGVIRGPDLWTFFYNNQNLLQDCIHPTYTESNGQLSGYEQLQRQWRDALMANVYNATPTGSPTRVTTTVPSVSPTASSTTTPTQSPLPTSTPTPTVPSASPTATSTATPSPSPAPTSTTTPTSGQINWVRGAYISPAGTTSSPSLTLSGVSAGDLLVVSLDIGGGKMETATNCITSNGPSSLSWSQVVSDVHGQSQVNLWYAFAPMSGAYSITGHATAPTAMSMAIDEYSGVNHSAPVLTWGSGGGFSTMPSAASSTPVAAGSLILGSVTWDSGNKVLTVGTGFSARQTVTNGNKYQPLGIEDQVSATSATPQASWMFNSSASWTAAMVVFGR
ncbi:MAG TPA: SGNH/GDSL hydrolase family protein, partial [Chloroflexota bacterium]